MNKSIIFWGLPDVQKMASTDICSLLFNPDKILNTVASGFKPESLSFKERCFIELVIVDECFEEEQIIDLEARIRKSLISGGVRIIYIFHSESPPLFLSDTKYHIVECIANEPEPVHLSDAFEKVIPENMHLLQSTQLLNY